MATCKRCEGRRLEPTILPDENGVWRRGEMPCGACKGTGEVSDDESAENLARIEKAWRIRNLIYVSDEPEGPADSKTNEEVSDGDA